MSNFNILLQDDHLKVILFFIFTTNLDKLDFGLDKSNKNHSSIGLWLRPIKEIVYQCALSIYIHACAYPFYCY